MEVRERFPSVSGSVPSRSASDFGLPVLFRKIPRPALAKVSVRNSPSVSDPAEPRKKGEMRIRDSLLMRSFPFRSRPWRAGDFPAHVLRLTYFCSRSWRPSEARASPDNTNCFAFIDL